MRYYFYALVLAATLAGCSADSDSAGGQSAPFDPSTAVPLGISTALVSGVESPATRGQSPLVAGSIGVFLQNAVGVTSYTPKPNIKYTVSGGIWKAATLAETLYLGGDYADVCAYYPHNVGFADKTAIAMTTQPYLEEKVFYYDIDRPVRGASTERSTAFVMKQAYSQLELNIVRDATYPSACKVSALTVVSSELTKVGSLNITKGTYSIIGTGNYVVGAEALPFTLLAATNSKKINILIIPQLAPMSLDLNLSVTVDGQTMSTTIPKESLPQFLSGKKYTVNVSVQGAALKTTLVSIEEWQTVSVDDPSSKFN